MFLKKKEDKELELETVDSLKQGRFNILTRIMFILLAFAFLYLIVSVFQTAVKNIEERKQKEANETSSQVRIEISKEEIWKRRTEKDIATIKGSVETIGQDFVSLSEELKKTIIEGLDSFESKVDLFSKELKKDVEDFKAETKTELRKASEEAEKIAKLQAELHNKALNDRIDQIAQDIQKQPKVRSEDEPVLPQMPPPPNVNKSSQVATDSESEINYEAVTINQVPVATNAHKTTRLDDSNKSATTKKTPSFTVLTSIGQATLVNGFAAPTFTKGEKGPVPTLLRVDTELIMPNDASAQTEGCFLLGVASGDISSERADVRISRISCVLVDSMTNEKYMVQEKVEGWVFGDEGSATRMGDSMYGLSGRLVTRNGTMLLRLLMVGFLQGVANSLGEQNVLIPGYQEDASGTFSQSLVRGAFTGSNTALEKLADYYMKMADETFPVIEVLGGRKVSFMLKGGESLPVAPFEAINVDYFQNFGGIE